MTHKSQSLPQGIIIRTATQLGSVDMVLGYCAKWFATRNPETSIQGESL